MSHASDSCDIVMIVSSIRLVIMLVKVSERTPHAAAAAAHKITILFVILFYLLGTEEMQRSRVSKQNFVYIWEEERWAPFQVTRLNWICSVWCKNTTPRSFHRALALERPKSHVCVLLYLLISELDCLIVCCQGKHHPWAFSHIPRESCY